MTYILKITSNEKRIKILKTHHYSYSLQKKIASYIEQKRKIKIKRRLILVTKMQ
jgi:hypothetical protein